MASPDKGEIQTHRIEFKHFDVVPEASDHHYISKNKKHSNNGNSSFPAHIMKEWKILEKNLPESIYVQVYETRIDLLRAVIIGSPATPYHDGLFFFDLLLPSDYPKSPPKVYYHSHGYRLNPNLYGNGKVCLSLINTWYGNKVEKWRRESTILQVLVSIQGLVLNDRPCFNEPMHEVGKFSVSPKWINWSNEYNEGVYILSCWSMIHLMQRPPENFEDFVAQHFCERAEFIMAAINAYRKGVVPVGKFHITSGASSSSSKVKVSKKFETRLAETESKLKKNFDWLITGQGLEKQRKRLEGCRNGSTSASMLMTSLALNSSSFSKGRHGEKGKGKGGLLKGVGRCLKWCGKSRIE